MRDWFRIDRAWVKWREAILNAEEDGAILRARHEAPTPELRVFVERVIEERERNAVGARGSR